MVNQFFGAAAPDSAEAGSEAAAPSGATLPPPTARLAASAPSYAAVSDDTIIAMPVRPPVPALPDVEQTLIANAVNPLLLAATQHGISELHITTTPGPDGAIRFQVSGVLRKA
jgi:hypothetical protein